ncbi:zinc finger MYM-type protein 1-like protein [Tanacetum coccineum]
MALAFDRVAYGFIGVMLSSWTKSSSYRGSVTTEKLLIMDKSTRRSRGRVMAAQKDAKDDPRDSDRFHLMRELDLYRVNVVQNEDFSKLNTIIELAKEMVRLDKHSTFPMIYKLLKLALVLPVATTIVERCFSTMKLIKSDLRNRMGDRFLNHALVCSIEKEIFINVKNEDVMKRFQSMRDRKGKLI